MEFTVKGIRQSLFLKIAGYILLFTMGGAGYEQFKYSFFNRTGGLTMADEVRLKDHLEDKVMSHMTHTERIQIAVKEEGLNNLLVVIQKDIGEVKSAIKDLIIAVNKISN